MLENIGKRFLEIIGLTTERTASLRSARAYEQGFFDAEDEPPSGDIRRFGYQNISSNAGLRDLTQLTHDQILEAVWATYQNGVLPKRYLEIVKDHVIGRGVRCNSDDEKLRDILKTFWDRNKIDQRIKKFTLQLRLWGEQIYPVFVRESDGRVTLAYIDPSLVLEVVTHPENVLEEWAVVLKPIEGRHRCYRIIRDDEGYTVDNTVIAPAHPGLLVTSAQVQIAPWEAALLRSYDLPEYSGSCFYFSINNVSNQPRGFSDMLQSLDWLDADGDTLFSLADREQFASYFSWDVTLEDASPEEVNTRTADIRRRVPRRGMVNVHNNKEMWDMKQPDLGQPGSIATSEALKDQAWGAGLGLPVHWRGKGAGTNFATAKEMGGPVLRGLESKQDDTRMMLESMLQFVWDQAKIAGTWNGPEETTIDVEMPEVSKPNMQSGATVLGQTVGALVVAMNDLQVITRETAAQVVAKAIAELGVEYDPDEELATLDSEQPQETAEAINLWLREALNGDAG
jgi:hypothetical protein